MIQDSNSSIKASIKISSYSKLRKYCLKEKHRKSINVASQIKKKPFHIYKRSPKFIKVLRVLYLPFEIFVNQKVTLDSFLIGWVFEGWYKVVKNIYTLVLTIIALASLTKVLLIRPVIQYSFNIWRNAFSFPCRKASTTRLKRLSVLKACNFLKKNTQQCEKTCDILALTQSKCSDKHSG